MSQDRVELTRRIGAAARELGFDRCAAAPVRELEAPRRLAQWVEAGMHGSMAWMERNLERRSDPAEVVPAARSVLLVTRDYWTGDPHTEDPARGRISRYAWGEEYHEVMGDAIRDLHERVRELAPGARGRYYVDTGPVLEKAWAAAAGLGWIGKHTNLLTVGHGSWFFLGAIILDIELDYGEPATDHCGSCRACIDVCPTDAIVEPYVLDARRCISYLTIENRGPIPREFRADMGNRIFGCDDCQDICPWNRFATASRRAQAFAPRPENRAPTLVELLQLDEEGFRERFRGSPVKRAKRAGFVRNVAVALGNSGRAAAVGPLARALGEDPDALVRGHVAWALGRLGGADARAALHDALDEEDDAWVREEIELALEDLPPRGA